MISNEMSETIRKACEFLMADYEQDGAWLPRSLSPAENQRVNDWLHQQKINEGKRRVKYLRTKHPEIFPAIWDVLAPALELEQERSAYYEN